MKRSLLNREKRLERTVEALTFKKYVRARANSKKASEWMVCGRSWDGTSDVPQGATPMRLRKKNQPWDVWLGSLTGKSLAARYRRVIVNDAALNALWFFLEKEENPDSHFEDIYRHCERAPHVALQEARVKGEKLLELMRDEFTAAQMEHQLVFPSD